MDTSNLGSRILARLIILYVTGFNSAFAPPGCILSDAPCMVGRLVSGRLHFSCDDALPVPLLFV